MPTHCDKHPSVAGYSIRLNGARSTVYAGSWRGNAKHPSPCVFSYWDTCNQVVHPAIAPKERRRTFESIWLSAFAEASAGLSDDKFASHCAGLSSPAHREETRPR